MDSGHAWPGTHESAGFCRSVNQKDIDLDNCTIINNEWGNDFLLNRLFNY